MDSGSADPSSNLGGTISDEGVEIRDLGLNPALSELFSDSTFGLKYSSKNYEFLVKSMYKNYIKHKLSSINE